MTHRARTALLLPLPILIACAAPAPRTAVDVASAGAVLSAGAAGVPEVDHHAHIRSPEATAALGELKRYFNEPLSPADTVQRSAELLLAQMDSSGVRRAALLSVAYWFGAKALQGDGEEERVRAENDFVAAAVARHPGRFIGYCSVNPLRDYAIREIERCAAQPHLTGLKLHLGNSEVDLSDPAHVQDVTRVFGTANRLRMDIVMHMWTRAWIATPARGAADARVVLDRLLSEAPDVDVQLAHLAGGGLYGDGADQALGGFAAAIHAGDPRVSRLYFDIAVVLSPRHSPEQRARVGERIRQLGLGRILYGTDGTNAAQNWAELRSILPLTEEEFAVLRRNTVHR